MFVRKPVLNPPMGGINNSIKNIISETFGKQKQSNSTLV